MATSGEKIAALAVDLQASLDAAHAQSAEFADAFGRLNLALGTAVTAAELPDVVRKRLAAAYVDQEERAGYRARAEAAEKRAQDAAEAVGYVGHLGEEFFAFLRALKTRCEEAEAVVIDWRARDKILKGIEREREEWRTRALAAETALVERNREIDDLRVDVADRQRRMEASEKTVRSVRVVLGMTFAQVDAEAVTMIAALQASVAASARVFAEVSGLMDGRPDPGQLADAVRIRSAALESTRAEAASLRAQLAEARSANANLKAQVVACADTARAMNKRCLDAESERDSLRAQVENLRGGAEPEEPAVCSVAGCKADLSRSANGCAGCDRLLCAEHSSPIIFRPNVELPDIGVFCPECVAVLRREFTREMAVWLAALVQATINLAPYPPDVADAVVAIVDAAINALPPELRPTASAQSSVPLAAVFYGGPSAEHYIAKAVRTAWIRDLIASLPSPSEPKAGRWKCRRCSKEQKMNQDDNVIAAWIWNGVEWRHYCTGELQSHAGDRIGDAPEVTP